MASVFVLEQLEDLPFEPEQAEEITATLGGTEEINYGLTARVLLPDYFDELDFDQLVLGFSQTELFRRFGKLSLKAQEEFGKKLLRWVNTQRDQSLRSGHVNPDLKLEIEFQWSVKKRRRLAIFYDCEPRMGGSRKQHRNVFLNLTLL